MDMTARLQRELPPFPRWMGITVTLATAERVVAELTVREELCTSGEILHGGAIMAFADTVGALGTVVNLREGQGTTTVESKTILRCNAGRDATGCGGDTVAPWPAHTGVGNPADQCRRQVGGQSDPNSNGVVNGRSRNRM
jgi:hypothetical protein